MGGSDDADNLVALTPEEHYLAHLLLVKMYPDNRSLVYAANKMTVGSRYAKRSNKRYGWLKRRYSEVRKKDSIGSGNTQYGTMWITNGIESKKIKKIDPLPKGWKKGRLLKPKAQGPSYNAKWHNERRKSKELYRAFCDGGYDSIRDFANSDECDISHVSVSKRFKNHLNLTIKHGRKHSQ